MHVALTVSKFSLLLSCLKVNFIFVLQEQDVVDEDHVQEDWSQVHL